MSHYTAKHEAGLSVSSNSVPLDLRSRPQWVCYKLRSKPNGKSDKIPTDPETGHEINALSPDNWSSFERATAAANSSKHRMNGVGFALTGRDPFVCVDLDGCVQDGQPNEWAAGIIKDLDSYAELSPSQKGVHVWVYGGVPAKNRPQVVGREVEIYAKGRFMTITGDHLRGTPSDIGAAHTVIDSWFSNEPVVDSGRKDISHAPMPPDGTTVGDIIRLLSNERNTEKFVRLFYDGDKSGYGDDDSRADAALASKVVFYTGGDVDLAEAVMRRSALARPKWDEHRRGENGEHTSWLCWEIQKAIIRQNPDSFYYAENGFCRNPTGGIGVSA